MYMVVCAITDMIVERSWLLMYKYNDLLIETILHLLQIDVFAIKNDCFLNNMIYDIVACLRANNTTRQVIW